jgi:hypothetical protein
MRLKVKYNMKQNATMYNPKLLLQTLTQLQHILRKNVRENKLTLVFKKAMILKVKQICNKLQHCITPITTSGISTVATYYWFGTSEQKILQ